MNVQYIPVHRKLPVRDLASKKDSTCSETSPIDGAPISKSSLMSESTSTELRIEGSSGESGPLEASSLKRSSHLFLRSLRKASTSSRAKGTNTWSLGFLGGKTSSLEQDKSSSFLADAGSKTKKKNNSIDDSQSKGSAKNVDKAALKLLFLSSDMAKLLDACEQVATAIAESVERPRKHNKKKGHSVDSEDDDDDNDIRSVSTVRSEPSARSLGAQSVGTQGTGNVTGDGEDVDPHALVLSAETKELIQIEIMLQTRVLSLWKENLSIPKEAKNRRAIQQEMAAVHRRLARLFSLYGNDKCALGHFQEALQVTDMESERYKTLRLKARLMAKNEYWENAIEAINEAIQLIEQQEMECGKNLAQNDAESSCTINTSKKNCHSSVISAKVELASLYEKKGNTRKAIAILERCVVVDLKPWLKHGGINNSSPSIYRLCATVHGKLGILLLENGDDERAVVLLSKALEWCWEVYDLEHDRKMKKMAHLLLRALSRASNHMEEDQPPIVGCQPKKSTSTNEKDTQAVCWVPWCGQWSKKGAPLMDVP